MECLFDVADRAIHVQQQPIGVLTRHREALGLGELNQRLVILLRRAEPRRELLGREVVPVIRAGRVVKLLEKRVEFGLVAKRQADGQIQPLRGRGLAYGGQPRHRRRNMAAANQVLPCCHRSPRHEHQRGGTRHACESCKNPPLSNSSDPLGRQWTPHFVPQTALRPLFLEALLDRLNNRRMAQYAIAAATFQ